MNATDLLARGYLPRELPPPFSTESFASFVTTSTTRPPGYLPASTSRETTIPTVHSLARAGSFRRPLSIPNPIAYEQLSNVVADNWTSLLPYTAGSPISLTTPKGLPGIKRAISRQNDFDALAPGRARTRAGRRFILQADISMFYGSIYTHSIPWAMHGKPFAKRNRSLNYIGNLLDSVVRNGQDQQTVGIPIGPDTSLLLAEILLTSVDRVLPPEMSEGIRYVDDYEFGCTTQSEGERFLAHLERALAGLELRLNPRKTAIKALPLPLEFSWSPELRLYRIRKGIATQATDLLSYFGRAFHLQPLCPEDAILKFAVARTRSVSIHTENWSLYEALLLQAAAVEPGTLSIVVEQLVRYSRAGYPLNIPRVAGAFNRVIESHGSFGGSEIAWALWGAIELRCLVDRKAADQLSSSDDSVVALLALDAKVRGLIPEGLDTSRWGTLLTSGELRGPSWLLAYEASIKGWLPPVGRVDFLAEDTYFAWLRDGGVSFYDTARSMSVAALSTPKASDPGTASGEDDSEEEVTKPEESY